MIAIVGGGLTGLTLAHELAKRGVPHIVLEATERPGGVIRSAYVRGHLLEWGPQRTRLTLPLRELMAELGIEDELITAPPDLPLFVYHTGKLRRVPFSVRDFLASDIFGWSAKARIILEPLTGGPRPRESVADFLTRKVGRDAYQHLVGPLYGGLYASDPAEMIVELSLGHVLREFAIGRSLLLPLIRRGGTIAPPLACSFREGMQTLPNALHHRNQENVRLGAPVHGLARRSGGYVLELERGVAEVETVVLTAPAPASARLLREVAPEAAERVGRLRYNPLAVVHLRAETDLVGLGYQVSLAETLHTRGVTWNDSLFGRRNVYTAYLGGAKSPEVVQRADAEVAEIAVREFRQVTGYDAEALAVERERMPAWDRSWSALQGLTLPPGLRIAANWQSRPGIPGRLAQARQLASALPERLGVER